jgi:L-alanine-DL-glutamate epimerase-like enolase superfamily enzyme
MAAPILPGRPANLRPKARPAPVPVPSTSPTAVSRVATHVLEAPADPPWRIATSVMSTMAAVLVEVELASGVVGWGESLARLAPGAVAAVVDELLGPMLLGKDAWNVEGIWDEMWGTMRARGHSRGIFIEAIAGVDTALWDALGRELGQPIARLLHGQSRREIACYASSILLGDADDVMQTAEGLVRAGHRALKVKIGRGPDSDAALARGVRAAVGPDVALMLDANGYYSADEAVRLCHAVADVDLAWLEEPLVADNLDGYRWLRRACPWIAIAAGEAEYTPQAALPLLQERLVDVIQPDVARAGGVTGCRRLADLAAAFGVAYAPHTGASSGVCIAASLQLAGGLPGVRTYEHMFQRQPLQDVVVDAPAPANGLIAIPRGPGLGLEVDVDVVHRYERAPL